MPGQDGVERYKSFYRDRLVEIRGFIIGSSESDMYTKKNALEKAFDIHELEASANGTDGFLPIEFTETGQNAARYYLKPIRNTMNVSEKRTGFSLGFSVLLEARDPRKYETIETDYTISPSDSTAASALPFVLPQSLAGNSYTASITINNTGSGNVLPTSIRIQGRCIGPILSNDNGAKIQLTTDVSLLDTEYLLIEPQYGKIYKYDAQGNGVNMLQYLTSDSEFFTLDAGNNVITYSAETMFAGSYATITIRFTS